MIVAMFLVCSFSLTAQTDLLDTVAIDSAGFEIGDAFESPNIGEIISEVTDVLSDPDAGYTEWYAMLVALLTFLLGVARQLVPNWKLLEQFKLNNIPRAVTVAIAGIAVVGVLWKTGVTDVDWRVLIGAVFGTMGVYATLKSLIEKIPNPLIRAALELVLGRFADSKLSLLEAQKPMAPQAAASVAQPTPGLFPKAGKYSANLVAEMIGTPGFSTPNALYTVSKGAVFIELRDYITQQVFKSPQMIDMPEGAVVAMSGCGVKAPAMSVVCWKGRWGHVASSYLTHFGNQILEEAPNA